MISGSVIFLSGSYKKEAPERLYLKMVSVKTGATSGIFQKCWKNRLLFFGVFPRGSVFFFASAGEFHFRGPGDTAKGARRAPLIIGVDPNKKNDVKICPGRNSPDCR